MAKKWGKRGKQARRQDPDPRSMFGAPQAPRSAPPASSTPLADHLGRGWPGVDQGYVVLPRTLAESMPLPWQQQLANLMAQFHETHGRLSWPAYRVVPSRPERLIDLDEEQLAEVGYLVEIDSDGEMVYRERSGKKVEDPAGTTVLVSCLDPIARQVPRRGARQEGTGPAPMNIGPQPVWRTTAQASASAAPPLPPPPTAPSVSLVSWESEPESAAPQTRSPQGQPVRKAAQRPSAVRQPPLSRSERAEALSGWGDESERQRREAATPPRGLPAAPEGGGDAAPASPPPEERGFLAGG
ncbi:hypothetical protein SAMN05421630_11821 [Prauserella marina]|uniref:Uncharacterized protein n=1 Tax=Prauserella marina TaxID=530584 RepID=A0A1G6ZKG0_9PSEU|nr:hypothetical protein [Prauserella marina]PWV70573.1 hypothetical protein DES30_11520 [Prauserella marina]SDE03010.1 hypothetical protein SAMN05421630_11821 [Prauserella marina]